MFAPPISKPRFKSIIFNQNSPKIKLFLQKNAKFSSAGGSAPDPRASGGWGLFPKPAASSGRQPKVDSKKVDTVVISGEIKSSNFSTIDIG